MADRRHVPVPPDGEWLYYRIHVDPADGGDRLLAGLVRPVVSALRESTPDLRWFFLRFLDRTGFHVRLRLHAAWPDIDRVERVLDGELAAAQRRSTHSPSSTRPTCTGYGKHVYAPEWHKFGTADGVRIAEELFQAGSEFAVDCIRGDGRSARVAHTAAHMLDMVTGLPEPARPVFLHQYAWYWSGGPARRGEANGLGALQRDAATRTRALRVLAQARSVLASAEPGDALRAYRARFWAAMRDRNRRFVPRSDYFLLFHHLHLTNNRLGVFPGSEATIAGLLWLALRAERAA